jgi:hypothetical protein
MHGLSSGNSTSTVDHPQEDIYDRPVSGLHDAWVSEDLINDEVQLSIRSVVVQANHRRRSSGHSTPLTRRVCSSTNAVLSQTALNQGIMDCIERLKDLRFVCHDQPCSCSGLPHCPKIQALFRLYKSQYPVRARLSRVDFILHCFSTRSRGARPDDDCQMSR